MYISNIHTYIITIQDIRHRFVWSVDVITGDNDKLSDCAQVKIMIRCMDDWLTFESDGSGLTLSATWLNVHIESKISLQMAQCPLTSALKMAQFTPMCNCCDQTNRDIGE